MSAHRRLGGVCCRSWAEPIWGCKKILYKWSIRTFPGLAGKIIGSEDVVFKVQYKFYQRYRITVVIR